MTSTKLSLLAVILGCLLFFQKGAAQTCTGNFLTNPGFESNFTDWENTGTVATVTGGHGGTAKTASICGNGTRLYQTKNATAGETYTFKVWAKNNGTAATGTLALKFMNANWTPLVTEYLAMPNSAAWTEFTVSKLAPAGTVKVEVSIIKETGAGCLLADDACLTSGGGGNLPDYAPKNLVVASPMIFGQAFNFSFDIVNQGTAAGPVGSFTFFHSFISIDPVLSADDQFATNGLSIQPLAVGEILPRTGSFPTYNLQNPGTYYLIIVVDPDSQIPESNDNNNTLVSGPVVVLPATNTSCAGNLLAGGGFDNLFAGWTASTGSTIVTTGTFSGPYGSFTLNGATFSQKISATVGQVYSADILSKSDGHVPGSGSLTMRFLNASLAVLDQSSVTFSPSLTAWETFSTSKTAPTGTAFVEIEAKRISAESGYGLGVDNICLKNNNGTNLCSPDLTPPGISGCPASQNLTTAGTSATAAWTAPTATDACPGAVTLTSTHAPGSSFPIGSTTVTYTAKDAANNSTTCVFTINVAQPGGGTCANNLLQNPSFENNLTNWEGSGGIISTTASTGAKSVKLCQNNDLRQTLATTAGKNLILLFKARSETTGANKVLSYIKYLSASWQPLVTEFFDFATTATFAQATLSKTAPAGAAWVEIGFLKQTAGCVLVDEVCLSEGGGCANPLTGTFSVPTCDNNGTPNNPADDLMKFTVTGSGGGAATNFFLSTPNTQGGLPTILNVQKGVATNLSYSISAVNASLGGNIIVGGEDANPNQACKFTLTIPAIATCSSGGGACSFIKSYLPFTLSYGYADQNYFAQTAGGLEAGFYPNPNPLGGSPYEAKTIKTDANGNYLSTATTPFTATQNVFPGNSTRTAAGDFVAVNNDLNKPNFIKVNAAGTTVWSTTIGQYVPSIAGGTFSAATVIADGTGFIGAFTLSDGTVTPQFGELILIKVDANGAFVWQKKHSQGVSYPNVQFAAVSADGIFATVSTAGTGGNPTTMNLNKYDKTNGNLIWSTVVTYDLNGFSNAVLTSDGAVAVLIYELSNARVLKYNASTGALIGEKVLATFFAPLPSASFPRGMVATNDGGLVVAAGFGGTYSGDPNTVLKYLKINAALGLVWSQNFPGGWNFAPKAIATDGGILFLGNKGLDLSILKTTATGDLNPTCADSGCVLNTVTVSNLTCNNAGTDSNPLDDTYTYMVTIQNSGGCTGNWTGAGTTGNFGPAQTVSGGLIDAGEKTVSFADAGNPNSTVFSVKIVPPAFCSLAATGCGYETSSATFGSGFGVFSSISNTLKAGNFTSVVAPTGFPNFDHNYREVNLDATGAIGATLNQSVTINQNTTVMHTPDGNFVHVVGYAAGNISLKKVAPGGAVIWTKNVAFAVPTVNLVAGSPSANMALVTNDAIYLLASYETQTAPPVAPVHFNFVLKCDLNGVKISQIALPSYSLADYQVQTLHSIATDGGYIFTMFSSNLIRLMKVSAAGAQLFTVPILSDLPSASLARIEQNPSGTSIYETWYSNSQSGVTKFNATTGAVEWSASLGTAFGSLAQDGNFENVYVRNGSVTADGGIVVAFGFTDYFSVPPFQNTGFIYGKLSPSGHFVWAKRDVNIGDLHPAIGTADGGVIFSGIKTAGANWAFLKINSLGELTPSCGSATTLPDLTLANFTTTQTSVAVGGLLNFKFDLKNIGTGSATGSFTMKSYLSTDNVLSANDIQNGSVPTGNLAAGQTVAQVSGALTVPAGTAAGNYFLILKADADGQISESNENNNTLSSASTVAVTAGGGSGADLEVTLTADKTTVAQWSNVTYTLTAKNAGNATITNAVIQTNGCNGTGFFPFAQSFGMVYASVPGAPTKGAFNFVSQQWTLTNLAAGQSGVLTFTLFSLTAAEKKVVALSVIQSPVDPDSQPSATVFANCTPAQDDEAAWTVNLGQSGQSVVPQSSGESLDKTADFAVFPNPTDGRCSIELSRFLGKRLNIAVSDIFGKNVFSEKTDELKTAAVDLDLSGEMAGVYFIKISAEGQRAVVKRLIVSKL